MRLSIQRVTLLASVMLGVLAVVPSTTQAQKALVYCPVSVDATGCNAIVTALSGGAFPLGVDRGFDGTGGTVDLKTVDLFTYSVFVVPSLADGATSQPYAKLRDPEVVEHLKAALIGRIALWSGSPDQGASNRTAKDALIQNLTAWAAGAFGTAKGPGLVGLLDGSSSYSARYDWLRGITPLPVTADANLLSYDAARALNSRGTTILTSGTGPIAYANLATYGFQVPNGAPGVSLDAVGQTGTSVGGQVVLLTVEAGNTSGATVRTDKDDYSPGTTVVISGSGWQSGETVKLTLHMDPLRDADTELSATADGSGNINNTDFAPKDYDVGVRFVLTAVGQASGKRAQTTFTDAAVLNVLFTGNGTGTVNSNSFAPAINCSNATPTPGPVCTGSNSDNGDVTVVATPAAGSTFAGWATSGAGSTNCNNVTLQTCTISLNGNKTVTANFTKNAQAGQSITFNTLPSRTYGDGGFTLNATASSNLAVSYTLGAGSVGCSLSGANNAAVTIASATGPGQNCIIVASQPGNASFLAASNVTQSFTIAKALLTVTADNKSRAYGVANPPLTAAITGFVNGETLPTSGVTGSASLSTPATGTSSVGSYPITVAQGTLVAANYQFTFVSGTLSITAITVTPVFTADSKTYDGNNSATISSRSLSGVVGSDAVTLAGGAATFDTKNVGTGKTVTATGFTLGGAAAGNYVLSATPVTCTANIAALGITGKFTASNKPYDGTTSATVVTRTLVGVLGSDAVLFTGGTAAFDTKAVGTGKTVTLTTAALTGTDAGNYSLTSVATTAADITPLGITGAFTAENKVYDGSNSATVLTRSPVGAIGGDALSLTGGTATFSDKNVGNAKTVTLAGASLSGADAANYTLGVVATTTANITPFGITGTFTVGNKLYDGNTTATVLTRSVTGVIAPDVVSLEAGTAMFDNKNVGTGKTVTLAGATVSGAAASNYLLISVSTTTANITALGITGSFTAESKTYDGTASATVLTRSLSGALVGDVVSLTGGTATFADKNVGNGKIVTLSGASLAGNDAGNYTLTPVATALANITPLAVTGSFTADSKVYDRTTAATVATRLVNGAVAGDAVTLAGGTATFADKNVGTGKTVTLTGATLSGGDAANYTLASVVTALANITPLGLTGNFTASSKVFDGNTAANVVTRALNGVLGSDAASLTGGTATFDTRNAGAGKTVTLTGAGLTGDDAGNYSLTSVGTTTADITPLGITGSITAENKVYDGTTSATIATRTLSGVIAPDVVTYAGGTATFADKNVGTGKTVSATGLSLNGADAGNYSVNGTAATTATITTLAITGNVTAADKVYDGNASATIATRTLTGAVAGDNVNYVGGAATFADKVVGTAKIVTATGLSLDGSDAANYTVNATATATASITVLVITGSITAESRIYNGTNAATILSRTIAGVLATDVVSYIGGTATFDTKNVGTGKTVTATGLTLGGADAGNYSVNTSVTTAANITALAITGSVTANSKTYDGTVAAEIATRTLNGVISGDAVSYAGGTATFGDKNVGTAKTVSAINLALSGVDAGNYTVNPTATTTANITPAPLTIKADNKSLVFNGQAFPGPYTATFSELVPVDRAAGGQPNAGVLSSPVAFGGPAVTAVNAGNYNIVPSGAIAQNYTITFMNGTLTIIDQTVPIVSGVAATPNPVALNTPFTIAGTVSDVTTGNSNIASAEYSLDGGKTWAGAMSVASGSPTVTATTTLTLGVGVYNVCVRGTDVANNTSTISEQNSLNSCVLLAVYDPSAGFVTGGGWITSPTGAYPSSPSLSGKATFGFVSKYKKGQTTPDGDTEFQFHAAGFNFKSTSYEWLVIAGSKAQYKGSGTINGSGDFFFMLTAVDGDLKAKGSPDTFRMKVWNKTTLAVIYDNQMGLSDTSEPVTTLGGGSIQIHDK